MSIFGMELRYGQGCQPPLSRLMKSHRGDKVAGIIQEDQRKNFWRGIWGFFILGTGKAVFTRGAGRCHRLEGPKFLTEPLPVTRNHQYLNDAQRVVVGGNDDDDYDNDMHYYKNQKVRCGGGGQR